MKQKYLNIIFLLIETLHINHIQLCSVSVSSNSNPIIALDLPDGCLAAFRDAVLTAHNEYRKQHSSPALQSDSSIDSSALGWSQYLAQINVLKNSGSESLGENLFFQSDQILSNSTDCAGKIKAFLLFKTNNKYLLFKNSFRFWQILCECMVQRKKRLRFQ